MTCFICERQSFLLKFVRELLKLLWAHGLVDLVLDGVLVGEVWEAGGGGLLGLLFELLLLLDPVGELLRLLLERQIEVSVELFVEVAVLNVDELHELSVESRHQDRRGIALLVVVAPLVDG